jgi:hypothetical protein
MGIPIAPVRQRSWASRGLGLSLSSAVPQMIHSTERGPAGRTAGHLGVGLGILQAAVGDAHNLSAETFLGGRGRPRIWCVNGRTRSIARA